MKKLYSVNIIAETDIIVAADDLKDAHAKSRECWLEAIESITTANIDVTATEIKKKSEIFYDLASLPYGLSRDEKERSVGEIWEEIEKANKINAKDKAYKEWLEKYHGTFDFYKETQNG